MKLVKRIIDRIQQNTDHEISDLQYLSKMLGLPGFLAVSNFYTTELPQEAAHALKKREGRFVFRQTAFCANSPEFALGYVCA